MRLPWNFWTQLLVVLVSSLAMVLAFRPFTMHEVAWVGLVPFFLVMCFVSARRAAWLGWLAGLVYCFGNLHWFLAVEQQTGWLAAIGLTLTISLLTALFWIPPAVVTSMWFRRFGAGKGTNVLFMLLVACLWVGLEWMRSSLPAHLSWTWNTLAISQAESLVVIQIAEWTGVYGVSFLILMLNLGIVATVLRYVERRGAVRGDWHPEIVLAMMLIALSVAFGITRIKELQRADALGDGIPLRVASVQTNVPQYEKWDAEMAQTILDELAELSMQAAALKPEVILWPETALPDDIGRFELYLDALMEVVKTPILAGSMTGTDFTAGEINNSSVLLDTNLVRLATYNKQHLVVFGEFVPFPETLPFLKHVVPMEWTVRPGQESSVMQLPGHAAKFTPLICFEDTMPYLARRAHHAGARLLVNQTNDGWFDPYKASAQQAAHCVFRCIETRLPAVRAANTGVTCSIKPWGAVHDELMPNEEGHTRYKGVQSSTLRVPGDDHPATIYVRFGDVLPPIFLGIGLLGWIALARKSPRSV